MKDTPFTAARLLALYDQVAEAEDAIPRLRRFVLDLAVRGKLVAQEAGDEPAAELLKRIANAETPTTGRRGKQRDTSVSNALEELPFDAPSGWAFAPLGQLVRVLNGRAYKQQELLASGTPVLRVGNLFTSNHWYYSDLELDDDKYCEAGDLIYAWSASFGPFIWGGPRVIFHYHIWKLPLISDADLSKHYLYLFLQQKTREIKEAGHGISMVHMTKEKMEKLVVPLPPLAEQRRIVRRVEELMALCDQLLAARAGRETVRDRLTTATLSRLTAPDQPPEAAPQNARFALQALPTLTTHTAQIKTLRQTILNLAVRGKLVAQDPTDGPAAELLKRIAKAKALRVKAGQIPKKADPVRDPVWGQGIGPSGWSEIALGQVTDVITSGSRGWGEFYSKTGPGFVRAQNIRFGKLRLDDLACVNPPSNSEGSRTQVVRNDLLIVITGAGVTNPALLDQDLGEAYVSQHVGLVRPSDTALSPWLLHCLLADSGGRAELVKRAYGAGKPGLNLDNIRNLTIPLPPLAEQHRIVARVDALMALCDQLESSLTTATTTRSRLLEALLHEALGGQTEAAA